MSGNISIRPVQPTDREQWNNLYTGYAAFYKVGQTPEMRDTVWSWLMNDRKEVYGLVAADGDGKLIGLTHFRPYARPLSASTGGFLDDLFVDPDARGSGAGALLIEAVKAEGIKRGWTVFRWITAEGNYRARALYDRVAERTRWVTYDIKLYAACAELQKISTLGAAPHPARWATFSPQTAGRRDNHQWSGLPFSPPFAGRRWREAADEGQRRG